jgi:DNA invertase Pin-like site-specific DNA recombinase
MTKGARLIGYVRVSTTEQGEAGNGLEAQRQAITRECKYRGWQLLRIEEDVRSGASTKNRPGLERAKTACRRKEADGIVAAKIDRLSRSVIDFATLLEDARGYGYNVVALDLGVDLSSVQGELIANVLASVAQWERRIIGERTKAAMRIVKKRTAAQRQQLGKQPIGRPARVVPPELRKRIRRERKAGLTYRDIAARLEADSIPTGGSGGHWHASTVQRLLTSA